MATNQPPVKTGLLDFFRTSVGCQFVIPVYQRTYTWTQGKEVKKYLEDLKEVVEGTYKNHFLGIMIYLDKPIDNSAREFSVIDGQQRLTTTFLFLYALRQLQKENNQEQEIKLLDGQYLTNPYASEKARHKLKPLVADDDVYKCLVEGDIEQATNKQSNIYKNYNYILNYIKEDLIKGLGKTIEDIQAALNSLYIVCIPLNEDEDNPQKIFESINATGAKLKASDLIRNYLLMDLQSDTQDNYYYKYWKKLEEYISNDSGKLEAFFRMFLAAKTFNLVNKNAVYENFTIWEKEENIEEVLKLNDIESTEEKIKKQAIVRGDLLKEINRYAQAYNFMYTKKLDEIVLEGNIQQLSIKDKNDKLAKLKHCISEFRRNLSEMPAPAVMVFYLLYKEGKIELETFIKLIDLINTYLLRRSLCDLDTSAITRIFPSFIKSVLSECDEDYTNIYDSAVKHLVVKNIGNTMYMPSDEQMKKYMYDANMYNLRLPLRIALDHIELQDNSAPVDLSVLSVEHLLPQTPTDDWYDTLKIDDQTYFYNLNRLGNLTLASVPDNTVMSNNPWEFKNEVLRGTGHLKLNMNILQLDHWDTNEIETRTKELAKLICLAFPYPSINNETLKKETIHINTEGAKVSANLSFVDGSVEIQAGSTLANFENASAYPKIEEIREDLISEGIVVENEGILEFVKPYTVYSEIVNSTALSTAASIVLHGSRNGWEYWCDEAGKPLTEHNDWREELTHKLKGNKNEND